MKSPAAAATGEVYSTSTYIATNWPLLTIEVRLKSYNNVILSEAKNLTAH
jgi:hypothetical protein